MELNRCSFLVCKFGCKFRDMDDKDDAGDANDVSDASERVIRGGSSCDTRASSRISSFDCHSPGIYYNPSEYDTSVCKSRYTEESLRFNQSVHQWPLVIKSNQSNSTKITAGKRATELVQNPIRRSWNHCIYILMASGMASAIPGMSHQRPENDAE